MTNREVCQAFGFPGGGVCVCIYVCKFSTLIHALLAIADIVCISFNIYSLEGRG